MATDFAVFLRRFLTSHLAGLRGYSTNTIVSYRDAFKLLICYFRDKRSIPPDKLTLELIDAAAITGFLDWLHVSRHNSASTSNQRLAAIDSFFSWMQTQDPARMACCQDILNIPGQDDHPVFFNQHRSKLSRGGIAWILRKYQAQAADPALANARLSPHILRHSRAMHLYDCGVPLPYIRDILGHVDLSTTEIYARASTEAKRKALEAVYADVVTADLAEWNQDPELLSWLASL